MSTMDRVIKKINRTKREARSELKFPGGWSHNNYANTYDNSFTKIVDNCERCDSRLTSLEKFIDIYEKPNKPVIITNLTNNWPAHKKWTPERLIKKYRNQKFKCGEDDDGYNVKIKMKYYIPYCTHLCHLDDSPLYIFDGSFGEQGKKVSLLQDYLVPEYFREDLFKYTSDRRRPPYRWIVIGPARSGTGIHIDPLGTSAWNALIKGHKRWCLFPPDTPKDLIKVKSVENKKSKGEAITWFSVIYPRTKSPEWPAAYKPIEAIQRPGETIFVPSGWWHVVMNLDFTVAVTQNYVSTTNFPIVWVKSGRGRPRLSRKWYSNLKAYRPDLASLADEIDKRSDKGLSLLYIKDSSYSSSSSTSSSSSSEDRTSRSSSMSSTFSDGYTLNTGIINDRSCRWNKFKALIAEQQNGTSHTNGLANGYTNGYDNNNNNSTSNIERVRKRRRKFSALNGGTANGSLSRSNSSCSSLHSSSSTTRNGHSHHRETTEPPYLSDTPSCDEEGMTKSNISSPHSNKSGGSARRRKLRTKSTCKKCLMQMEREGTLTIKSTNGHNPPNGELCNGK